ncbi:hypothetical protein [Bythopirellula polymerisocia]|uniref:Uncharacterized protein n=1 Tax=Bythopirellula polymerisocia TaxID=2528003 RepID=A0A5C6CQJ1_9BACT|nr:hypothetical protein [Bythopirellula polymerisocia]TWU25711.1 hypothetical protein Pla144_29210 [Bythopirellula polymerisocia]
MACVHLQQLYQLCQDQQLRLGGSDLIRVVCHQCGDQEVCPSALVEERDSTESWQASDSKSGKSNESAATN